MALYVDNVNIPAVVSNPWTGRVVRGKWCHLISDLLDPELELHPFAVNVLGLKKAYFQQGTGLRGEYCPGHDHYDLTESKRALAIKNGAQAVSALELGEITIKKTQLWQAMVAKPHKEGRIMRENQVRRLTKLMQDRDEAEDWDIAAEGKVV